MKQFTLKLACLLGLLLSWGGDSWAQDVTYEAKPITSTTDITTEEGTYYAFMAVDKKNKAGAWNQKTGHFLFVNTSSAAVNIQFGNAVTSTNVADCIGSNPEYYYTIEKTEQGFNIKSNKNSKYWYQVAVSGQSFTQLVCTAEGNANATTYTLEAYDTQYNSNATFSIKCEDTYIGQYASGANVNNNYTSKGSFYYVIYKLTPKAEATKPTASFYFYNVDGTSPYNKEACTFDITEGNNTIQKLTQNIVPSYITATYYSDEKFTEEVTDLTDEITETSTFYVKTQYNSNFQYPQSDTEYFALKSLFIDAYGETYDYYLGTSTGITTPTYRNRRSIAVRIDGDWYNGYSIISYNKSKLYLNGASASFDAKNDYKWKINNENRFVDEAGRFLRVTNGSFTTTTFEDYAAKLASTEAVESIKNSAPEGYVGSLDKSAADGITFDDLIKDNFTKLALEVGKYYFIETAENPTKAISSAEVAYIYGSSILASKAQKIKASHSFPELWKYASDKQFVNANTDYYLAPSGNLTHSFSGWEDPFQLEVTNNDETVFQMKVSSGSNKDKYLEINEDEVKATQTTTKFKGWRFRLAESIDINLTKNGDKSYATTCAPVAVTLSKDDAVNTTLYIEKSHTESSLSVVKAEAVAANTGIYVMNTEGATSATLLLANSGEASQANDAILKGTTITQDISSADHSLLRTLGITSGKIGFFKPASTITVIPANRAYLRLSNISQTNAFYIDFDGTTTSIDELLPATEAQDNAPIYDLSGRRMQGTLHKGIYIQNGRKFMVK